MYLIKIEDNIYFLKGTRSSNIYYFNFKKKAIIDTGHPEDIKSNLMMFRENGFLLEKIDFILNTHSHGDHVGGNTFLRKLNSEIKITCSENRNIYQKARKAVKFMKNVEDNFEDFDIDIELKGNEKIDLGGCVLEAIETKGHTRDSMSFYLKEKGFLFSGDTFYFHIITQVDYYQELGRSVEELTDTYKKIKKLNPLKIFTGHGDPINNPAENIDYCIKKLSRFNPEMVLINNFIPALEFFIYRNNGCDRNELKKEIIQNLIDFNNIPFLNKFKENEFDGIFEKMYSLMKILNFFEEKNGKIFLKRKLNEYLNIIK